jgi:hypothetical protein
MSPTSSMMKAVVLTYDRNRPLTDHMVLRYTKLWPDHPFDFLVPFQQEPPSVLNERVRYVETPKAIKGTVLRLLEDLPDEEWIYWCIDDKYPIRLDPSHERSMYELVVGAGGEGMDALLTCRCRDLLNERFLMAPITMAGKVFHERRDYRQIWMHQYVRVKVIRHLFRSFPDDIPNAKEMDLLKKGVAKPADHRLYVTNDCRSAFGESTSRGVLTRNCRESMRTIGVAVPAWGDQVTDEEIIIGAEPFLHRLQRVVRRKLGGQVG